MADSQITIASLRELNSKLTLEIAELRKKYAKVEAENIELKQIIEENTEFKTRFEDQDRKNKTDIANLINENTDLKSRVSKLEQKLSQNDEEKGDLIAKLDDDTPEQIENISDNISNSDIYQESNIQYSEALIRTDSESSENKEVEFLNRVHKETVSNEIRERNRKKKPQAQNSISYDKDNSSCDIKTVSQGNDHDNSSCDIKTVSQGNDRDNIEKDLDDSDETELTKNQNIELDLIRDLRNCMLIASPDPIEISSKDIVGNEKPSSKITTQSLIHLFKKAIRSGYQEILSWICYSDNFENKVIEIRHKAGVNDKTARTQIYKEMLEHLPGVTSVALRIKTLRARKIRKLFGENGVGINKVKYVTCSANDISKLTNAQIQNIINQVTSKTVSLGNNQNHATETEH
ncbi:hypothetical protein C2G38_2141828 [Gigaspora rosea]|uniref:Uncharacterized protein n=1 Tax=Gigaspora rosea TaxID=44941 RepID=A0A397VBE6_9GLOM|nr:hypothetical protein C2G38_2141828 [Gigaspora rosea]